MKKFLLIIGLVIPCVTTYAATYMYKTEDGSTIITNKPRTTPNVAKFYQPVNWKQNEKKTFEYLKPGEDVEVIETSNEKETYQLLSEEGYIVIGYSDFKDTKISNATLIAQARKVGAQVVTSFRHGYSISVSVGQQDPNKLDTIYNYSVIFYVKSNLSEPGRLGFVSRSIPMDKRSTYQRNTGEYVDLVYKGSRAYKANIIPGDVIIAVNDTMVDHDDFIKIKELELKKTKTLNLRIIRLVNNELKEIVIPISFE